MIRHAEPADKVAVINLLRASHTAAGFDTPGGFTFAFDPAYAERLFLTHLMPHHVCLLLDVEGTAGGVLMASYAEHPFGAVRIARETVWFIDRHYRGLGAVRMLDTYELWARANRCAFIGMAGMGDDPEVGRLYLRRGFKAAERHFLKAI
jgi:hypothetical protein